jgi:hypothetical protein
MKSDDKDLLDKGATLTMSAISAAKERLKWGENQSASRPEGQGVADRFGLRQGRGAGEVLGVWMELARS